MHTEFPWTTPFAWSRHPLPRKGGERCAGWQDRHRHRRALRLPAHRPPENDRLRRRKIGHKKTPTFCAALCAPMRFSSCQTRLPNWRQRWGLFAQRRGTSSVQMCPFTRQQFRKSQSVPLKRCLYMWAARWRRGPTLRMVRCWQALLGSDAGAPPERFVPEPTLRLWRTAVPCAWRNGAAIGFVQRTRRSVVRDAQSAVCKTSGYSEWSKVLIYACVAELDCPA